MIRIRRSSDEDAFDADVHQDDNKDDADEDDFDVDVYQDENIDVGSRRRGSFVPQAKLPLDDFHLQIDQLGKMKAKVEKDKVLYE